MKRNHYIRLQVNLRRFFLFSVCIIPLIFSSGVSFSEVFGAQGKDDGASYRKSKKAVVSSFSIKYDVTTIPSDGSTGAEITATAKNKKGKPIQGVKIRFSVRVGKGTLTPFVAKTGIDGKAKSTVTSTKAGNLWVQAKTKNVSPSRKRIIKITVTEETSVNISLIANKSTIAGDGTSTATFTAELRNNDNNPVSGTAVKFSTDNGKITPAAVTDSSGLATVVLTSEKDFIGIITVTAIYGTDTKATATIESVESSQTTSLVIVADKTSISADGTSTAVISAQLRNEKNNPIIGATVYFASEKGTITGSSNTVPGVLQKLLL